MNKKVLGALSPVLGVILIIVGGIIASLIANSTSNDGWAALGALLMVFFIGGIGLIILLIVGIVLYAKNKSEYGLGVIISSLVIFGFGLLSFLLNLVFAI